VHVAQARLLGFERYPSVDRWHLTKRYAKKKAFRASTDETIRRLAETMDESRAGRCSPALAPLWTAYQASVPGKHRQTSEDYVIVEGFARYVEEQFEAAEAGETFAPAEDCAGVVDHEYGYALGCMVAGHLARCGPENWQTEALRAGLSPLVASEAAP